MSSIEFETAQRLAERAGFTPSPDALALIDEHISGVEKAAGNRDLRPEAVARLRTERHAQTAQRLRELEAQDLEAAIRTVDKDERKLLASIHPEELTFGATDTRDDRQQKISLRVLTALERQERREQARDAEAAIRASSHVDEIDELADDVAMLGDPVLSLRVQRARVGRLTELHAALPEQQRANSSAFRSLMAAQDVVATLRKQHPGPSRQKKAIAQRRQMAETNVRQFYANIAQLLKVSAVVEQSARVQAAADAIAAAGRR